MKDNAEQVIKRIRSKISKKFAYFDKSVGGSSILNEVRLILKNEIRNWRAQK